MMKLLLTKKDFLTSIIMQDRRFWSQKTDGREVCCAKTPAGHGIFANSVNNAAIFLFNKHQDARRVPIAA
jgi:hypothetical protein